jgi:hypothetical protein
MDARRNGSRKGGREVIRYAHWLLPFVVPFVLLGQARVLWWAAGAEWSVPESAAFACLFMGMGLGLAAALAIEDDK